ncbi:hypothetical protein [Parachlamydia sp. AcF125]|uniref:hypothetical protein n=1 Tax=Parachlamydia sp. AcF125 TaxID=2795736 RepID=UPI002015EF22|nr:hypothetical protein [Parachlamydia sp. AcF125]
MHLVNQDNLPCASKNFARISAFDHQLMDREQSHLLTVQGHPIIHKDPADAARIKAK